MVALPHTNRRHLWEGTWRITFLPKEFLSGAMLVRGRVAFCSPPKKDIPTDTGDFFSAGYNRTVAVTNLAN